MANGNPVFSELLEIKVLTDQFAQEMRKVEQIYADSIKRMPQIGNVGAASFAASIQQLNQTIQQLQTGGTQVIQGLAQNMLQTANIVQTQVQNMSNAVTTALGKVTTALNQTRQARQRATGGGGGRGGAQGFFGALTSNIPTALGQLLKVKLMWDAIGASINLVYGVISAPFKAIAEGVKYLEDFQDRSSVIKAALLQSVQFSSDWGQNVKLAGQEADNLVRKIDTLATQLRVKSQIIQTGFTTFLEFGGRNLTKNLEDALQVSALAVAALQSQNPNIQTRKIATEMQQLVSGTLSNTSKLAAAFGVSAQQLNQMAIHARTTHDLLGDIVAKSPGLTQRLIEANSRFGSLSEALDLYKKRWEALLAGPLFDQFIKFLQNSLNWLDKHQDDVQAIGRAWGEVVGLFGKMLTDMGKLNQDSLKEFAQFLATALTIAAASAVRMVNAFSSLIQFAQNPGALKDLLTGRDFESEKQDLIKNIAQDTKTGDTQTLQYDRQKLDEVNKASAAAVAMQKVLDNASDADKAITDAQTKAIALINGIVKAPPAPKDTEPANIATHGIIGDKPDARAVMTQFEEELEELKKRYQELRDEEANEVAQRKVSHAQAAQFIAGTYKQEGSELDTLVQKYKGLVSASGGDQKSINSAMNRINKTASTLYGSFSHGTALADKAGSAETYQKQKDAYKASLALEKQQLQEELQLQQEFEKEGYITEVDFLDKKEEARKREHQINVQILQSELNDLGKDTLDYQRVLEQLKAENDRYTAGSVLASEQRKQAIEKENHAYAEYQIQLLQVAQQQAQIGVEISKGLGQQAQINAQVHLLELKRQELDLSIKTAEAELALQKAKNGETDATRKLEIELQRLNAERNKNAVDIATAKTPNGSPAAIAQAQKRAVDDQIKQANQQLVDAMNAWINAKRQEGETDQQYKQRLTDLQSAVEAAKLRLQGLADVIPQVTSKFKELFTTLTGAVLGNDFLDNWKNLQGATGKTAALMGGLANGIKFVQGIIGTYEQGRQQGGVLGGIGAVGSQVGGILMSNPATFVPGAIITGISSAFSLIGGLFTAAAKRIANQIKAEIDSILKAYQNGTTTLGQTISQLEKERNDAIARLSGKKDGKKELDQILPQLDDQIAQLKKQAQDTMKAFEDQLSLLRQSDDTLKSFLQNWMDINKQVKDYLDAGGDIAKAHEFLTLSLQAQQRQIASDLRDAQDSAIQDALKLNDLLKQRVQLVKDEKAQEFDLLNQDAIERRASNAITTGQQIKTLRDQLNDQLTDLDSQIRVQQYKVDKETELFNLTSDINELHRQDEVLQEKAIDDQLAKVVAMQQILAGIVSDGQGGLTLSPDLMKLLGAGPSALPSPKTGAGRIKIPPGGILRYIRGGGSIQDLIGGANLNSNLLGDGFTAANADMSTTVHIDTLQVNNNGTTPVDGAQIVDSMSQELSRRTRYGLLN